MCARNVVYVAIAARTAGCAAGGRASTRNTSRTSERMAGSRVTRGNLVNMRVSVSRWRYAECPAAATVVRTWMVSTCTWTWRSESVRASIRLSFSRYSACALARTRSTLGSGRLVRRRHGLLDATHPPVTQPEYEGVDEAAAEGDGIFPAVRPGEQLQQIGACRFSHPNPIGVDASDALCPSVRLNIERGVQRLSALHRVRSNPEFAKSVALEFCVRASTLSVNRLGRRNRPCSAPVIRHEARRQVFGRIRCTNLGSSDSGERCRWHVWASA